MPGLKFAPFLDYTTSEIRKIICSTNAIESLNARYWRAVRVRGHFPNEQAALKCLYLTTRSLDPTGKGKARWATRWKPALNACSGGWGVCGAAFGGGCAGDWRECA